MTNRKITPPPVDLTGYTNRPGRGGHVVEKPKNMKGTLLRLWDLTRGHRNGLGWIMLLSALSSASAILSPLVIGKFVTKVNNHEPTEIILFTLLGLYLCDWLVRFSQQFFMASLGQKIIHYIRTTLFNGMKKLPLSFFDRKQHGELMSRMTNDVDNISNTISNSLSQLLTYFFTIIGIFCTMISLSPLLTLVSLTSVVLIVLLTKGITKHTRQMFIDQQKNLGELNAQVEESISGLNVVKAFCLEDYMIQDFEKRNENLCQVSTRALIWSGYLMPIMNVINNLCYAALSVASGIMAVKGMISIGMISSFLLYVRQFTRPFVEIANIYNNFQTAVAGAERIFEIMDEQPEPPDIPNALPLKSPNGDFELKNVSFEYIKGKPILKNISLHVPAGTKTAIVGPTGAGKTTVVNLLNRFYEISSGEILLDGHDLREYRMKDLRDAYGTVLQDTALFAASIKDNICYGIDNVSMPMIEEAVRVSGADAFISRLPNSYEYILTESGNELSQGERQQLTIARAILTNAPILILDEATSSVDTVTEQKIHHAMLTMTEGRTSFIIAHRLSTIRDSDLIILINNGTIAEQGTHEELMALNGQYASMFHTQIGK